MHARRDVIEEVLERLSTTSPAVPVFEQEQTALDAPCFQVAFGEEGTDYSESTRARLSRSLACSVTVRATSPEQRESLCELLEAALLTAPFDGLEINFERAVVGVPIDGGQRTYPATCDFQVRYFTDR